MAAIIQAHVSTTLPSDDDTGGARTRQDPESIMQNGETGVKEYAKTFLIGPSGEGEEQVMGLWHIFKRMNFVHQIKARADLIHGDFSCFECGSQGHRDAVQVYTHQAGPAQYIIPIRDDDDRNLVAALQAGWRPSRQGKKANVGRGRGSGNDGRRQQGRQKHDKTAHGRITKQRVAEKKRVINELGEAAVIDLINDMNLF
jgi:hypothetical protein